MNQPAIIAVSPDPIVGRVILDALASIGAVDLKATLEAVGTAELTSPLCVIHLSGGLARIARDRVPRLAGGCPVIAILPRADLGTIVQLMQSSTRFVGVMVEEELDPHQLAAMARRIVEDRVFGIEQILAPARELLEWVVSEDAEKVACMHGIAGALDRFGVMRGYREPIEQCVDEMVTNALYDAPVAADGSRPFSQTRPQDRINLRTDHAVTVRLGFDGARVVVGVRDRFGSLDRRTVIRFLDKGLHSAAPVDRKIGGAGVGLYLMVNAAAGVDFLLLPGFATEVVCSFEVQTPPRGLAHVGVFVQRDPGGEQPATPARVVRSAVMRRRQQLRVAGLAALVALAVGAGVGARKLRSSRRAVVVTADAPLVPRVATIELESNPPGATILVDGKPIGETPFALTTLAPGATANVAFELTGFAEVKTVVRAPAVGATEHVMRELVRSADFVTLHVSSTPAGAEIVQTGKPSGTDRTYTPAELLVPAEQPVGLTLTMPNHVPYVVPSFVPHRGGGTVEITSSLVAGATLHIDAKAVGEASVVGAAHCQHLPVPCDCTLAPGTYAIELVDRNHTKVTHTLVFGHADAVEHF